MIRIVAAIASLSVAGCSAFGGKPEIRDRYATMSPLALPSPLPNPSDDPYRQLRYQASVSTTEVPQSDKAMPVTALSDRAQAAYVAALAASAKDNAGLSAALASPLKPKAGGTKRYVDARQIERRFILALTPVDGLLAPGDRLAWARLRIRPVDARFVEWTVAFNKRNAINVGTVKATQSTTLKGETGLKIGGPLAETSVSTEATRSIEESATITDASTIDAKVTPSYAEVIQSAGWREDLTGNATFDATFEVTRTFPAIVFSLGDLWNENNPVAGPEIDVSRQTLDLPDEKPLCATLELDYVVRHIAAGARTFSESDDKIKLARGRYESGAIEVAPQLLVPRYGISAAGRTLGIVRTGVSLDDAEDLSFGDVETALSLIDWLRETGAKGARLGAYTLVVTEGRTRRITRRDIAGLATVVLAGGVPLNGAAPAACPAAGGK